MSLAIGVAQPVAGACSEQCVCPAGGNRGSLDEGGCPGAASTP